MLSMDALPAAQPPASLDVFGMAERTRNVHYWRAEERKWLRMREHHIRLRRERDHVAPGAVERLRGLQICE